MESYAKVAFPQRFPKDVSDVFDYAIPEVAKMQIKKGSGVFVPFRKRKKLGIVVGIESTTNIPKDKIRSIEGLAVKEPLLREQQLSLLLWLKEKTNSTYGTILNSMIPDKPIKTPFDLQEKKSKKQRGAKKKIELHWFDKKSDLIDFLKQATSARNLSTLVVFPDRDATENFSKAIASNKPVVMVGQQAKKSRFVSWQSIYAGKRKNVIGTRMALLLPFGHLDNVFLVDEEDRTHQRVEQHPDIDSRTLALHVGKLYDSAITFTTVCPSIETLWRAKNDNWNIVRHQSKSIPDIKIIDTSEFLKKRQSTLLPQDAVDFMNNEKQRVVLIYNHKGYGSLVRCMDCGWEAHCIHCGAYLSASEEKAEFFSCRRCHRKASIPIQCPQCHNVRLKMHIPGIFQLADRLKKLIPQTTIDVLEKNGSKSTNYLKAKIIFTTSYGIPLIPWETVGSCMMLDIDFSLNFPDYRATEWTLHRIKKIASLMNKNATLFLMTKHAKNPLFASLQSSSLTPWYKEEIEERKKLHFPPFSSHIGLFRLSASLQEQAEEERTVIEFIESILQQNGIEGTVISTTRHEQKTRQQYLSSLLVRLPSEAVTKAMAHLETLQKKGWKITLNPLDASGSDLYT